MSPHRLPLVPQIMNDPERAILAALEVTLDIAVNALVAAHPELCDDNFPDRASPAARCADRLITQARKMEEVLARYCYALTQPDRGEDEQEEDGPPF